MKRLIALLLALMLSLLSLAACDGGGSGDGGETDKGGLPVGEDPVLPDRVWD